MLNHHQQLCDMDCGRSAIITFTGKSMEEVTPYILPAVCSVGMYWGSILQAVNILNEKYHKLTIKGKPQTLSEYLKKTKVRSPQILLCRRVEVTDLSNQVHYIVVDAEENIYDPLEVDIIKTKDLYKLKQAHWLVEGLIY